MSSFHPLPEPGTLFGWGILYGERLQHRCTIVADELRDRAYAEGKAADLRGVLVELVIGPDVLDSRHGGL
jgi:hypothetical protein